MEVKEFVKTILRDVTEAVEESTKESSTHEFTLYHGENKKIEFDLAVVLKKEGMEISTVESSQKSESGEIVNRIKFSILPTKKNHFSGGYIAT